MSHFIKQMYDAEHLVESCGAILFNLQSLPLRVCLIYYKQKDEWLLAKGRRNAGETRGDAAVREVYEETGYRCRLLPLSMSSRQPPASEAVDVPDSLFIHDSAREWFSTQLCETASSGMVKQIWWYIAALEGPSTERQGGEDAFSPEFLSLDEALLRLTFDDDRKLLQKAVSIVQQQRS